jgi:hypothetical protein
MSILHDILKCAMCKETFTSAPVILNCCYQTVCESHMVNDEVTKSKKRKLFTCALCDTSHEMNNKKFVPNKTVQKLLEMELIKEIEIGKEKNLGAVYDLTNKEIENLELSFHKVNDLIKDPKNFIYERISSLKNSVDLRKEKLKARIDKICGEMIQKLENYQHECFENIKNLNLEKNSRDYLNEVEKHLDEWTRDNKRVLLVSDDAKRNEILNKASELDKKIFAHLNKLENELLMEKVWSHKKNDKVVEEFEKELIQFEGYILLILFFLLKNFSFLQYLCFLDLQDDPAFSIWDLLTQINFHSIF